MLDRIWTIEAPGTKRPDTAKIFSDAAGNIRAALMALEIEILVAEPEVVETVKPTLRFVKDAFGRSYAIPA